MSRVNLSYSLIDEKDELSKYTIYSSDFRKP